VARGQRITDDLLRSWIASGRGFGWFEGYQSWLRLNRRNASPFSTQMSGGVPPFRRMCHFWCRSEFLIAILLAWLGAWVREQVPIWPWRHPHPLSALSQDLDPLLPYCIGMEAICADAGIDHGRFIGTSIPYIWTIDIVATWPWFTPDEWASIIVSVKPVEADRFKDPDPICREVEKLEAERRYGLGAELPYFVCDRTLFPGPLLGNLEFIHKAAILPPEPAAAGVLKEFLQRHGSALQTEPPLHWSQLLQIDYRATEALATHIIHHCLWHQYIDSDLTLPLNLAVLPVPRGRAIQRALRAQFLGNRAR